MSPSPEEVAGDAQVAAADTPSAPAQPDAVAPPVQEVAAPEVEKPVDPPKNLLLYTLSGFLSIGVALWLILAWAGYKEKYSQQTEGWHLGSTKMLEITLIRDDKKTLVICWRALRVQGQWSTVGDDARNRSARAATLQHRQERAVPGGGSVAGAHPARASAGRAIHRGLQLPCPRGSQSRVPALVAHGQFRPR